MDEILRLIYRNLLEHTPTSLHRFLFASFELKDRLTGIIGPRGVGKTTFMLQYIKEKLDAKTAFYFSADHFYFTEHRLYDFVVNLHQHEDCRYFFIDEVHKYPNWDQELKNLYDGFPNIFLIFSGSSSLKITESNFDLSRRARMLSLPGLSFREYLNFATQANYPSISFEAFIKDHRQLDELIPQIPKLKGHFQDYLRQGFYPFYQEQPLSYHEKLVAIMDKTIFEDISEHYNIKTSSLAVHRKILTYLASTPPGDLSTHNLAKNMNADDRTILNFLTHLCRTGLIRLIYPAESGNRGLTRPEKIFLNNTNFQYALEGRIQGTLDIGRLRELAFIQMIQGAGLEAFHSKTGDYQVQHFYFEIGGKNKTAKQIKNSEHSFLVKDDLMLSTKIEIPLMYFGFLY
jgi:predicted AAA+ superfamily ATPase